jgi:glycosyltransferase involved in cell wall biosynthesis
LKRPTLTARLIAWLIDSTVTRPNQLIKSLILVPRAMGIFAALERAQPDVVHLFWGHYPCLVGFLVLTGLPRVVLSVFLGAYDLTRPFAGCAWVATRADLVSTHARWNFPLIEALGVTRDEIHVVYRGIDLTQFRGSSKRKIRRRIVAVGRLEPEKGIYEALRIFRAIHQRWPDATLHFLGEGPDRRKLERLARELQIASAVTFLGHVTQRTVAQEMAEAQVLLHMSFEETLPNVVKEAMASECVCVVSHTYGIEELVVDGLHGFVVPPADIDGAVSRISDVFTNRIDVATITAAAATHIARSFTVSRSMESYRNRWQQAIARRQAGGSTGVTLTRQSLSRFGAG